MSIALKGFTMIKVITILLFMNFSLAAFANDLHSGTRFLLKDYDDLVALKLQLKEKQIDFILEKPVLRKSKLGNELVYQVCVGFVYDESLWTQRSQAYIGNMPELENRFLSLSSGVKMGCDVNAEEYEL